MIPNAMLKIQVLFSGPEAPPVFQCLNVWGINVITYMYINIKYVYIVVIIQYMSV